MALPMYVPNSLCLLKTTLLSQFRDCTPLSMFTIHVSMWIRTIKILDVFVTLGVCILHFAFFRKEFSYVDLCFPWPWATAVLPIIPFTENQVSCVCPGPSSILKIFLKKSRNSSITNDSRITNFFIFSGLFVVCCCRWFLSRAEKLPSKIW